MNSEGFTDRYSRPCVQRIAGGQLLSSTRSSARGSVMTWRRWVGLGVRLNREGVHVRLGLIAELTAHCKSTILGKKLKKETQKQQQQKTVWSWHKQ